MMLNPGDKRKQSKIKGITEELIFLHNTLIGIRNFLGRSMREIDWANWNIRSDSVPRAYELN